MDGFSLLLDSVRIIGWVLLHFLWQAALVGAVYAIIRPLLPRGDWRYRVGMGALIVLAGCPVLTGWWLLNAAATTGQAAFDMAAVTVPILSVAAAGGDLSWAAGLNALLPWLVLAWFAGVLLLSLRACRQWRRLKILVRLAEQVPPWQARLNHMAGRFGLRGRISVLRSKLVITPVLVGWLRPVILLPLAVACKFPVAQIELILAHELAHLKRWDPVANLFQVVLETLHFYHPVVHWLSRDVRNEREICCDRLALSITGGSGREFAATLARLGELREHPGALLLAANGGVLLDRVQYMVLPGAQAVRRRTPARLVAVLLGTALIAICLRLEWDQAHRRDAISGVSSAVPSMMAPLAIAMKSPFIPALDVTAAAFLPHLARAPLVTPDQGDAAVGVREAALSPASIAMIPPKELSIQPIVLPKAMTDVLKMTPMASARSGPGVVSAAGLKPIRVRQPIYPQLALMRGVEGQVVIEFGLADDGSLRDLQVVQSEPEGVFDQAAVHAMRGWKYSSPTGNGTQRRYRQTMMFVLNAALARNHTASGARWDGELIQARADCQIQTGTHICRWPGDGPAVVKNHL